MAWEASLTAEAWANAYEDIQAMSHQSIAEALACGSACGDVAAAMRWPQSVCAESLYHRAAEEIRLTSNGGWELFLCPSGCHTIVIR